MRFRVGENEAEQKKSEDAIFQCCEFQAEVPVAGKEKRAG